MADFFREEVVVRRNRSTETLLMALANVCMVASAVIAMFMIQAILVMITSQGFSTGLLASIALALLMAAAAVLLFLYRDRIRTEYEYTFTNGTMDFAQVYNNRKRKPLGTMNVGNVEAFGKVNSGSFNRYLNIPGVARLNWFLNRDADLHYFYFAKAGKKTLMVIEPSEEMAGLIKRHIGQGKYQIN